MEIQNRLREIAGMSSTESLNKEVAASRRKKDQKDLTTLKKVIEETINPFSDQCNKDVLLSLKTGKQAPEEVENYLLNVISIGRRKRDEFIDGFQAEPSNFEESISKEKCLNFATDNLLKKNKSKKVQEIAIAKGTHDMFGRLLQLSTTNGLDLEKVFSFPIVPEPACFVHPDGTPRLSQKSEALNPFKKIVTKTDAPTTVDTVINDGMFLIKHMILSSCANFAGFSRLLLMKAMKGAKFRADLVFDTYESPDIKDE